MFREIFYFCCYTVVWVTFGYFAISSSYLEKVRESRETIDIEAYENAGFVYNEETKEFDFITTGL